MNNALIGERIKKVRASKNLTQQAFAESLDITQGFLSKIEKGGFPPAKVLLLAISYSYGININWLLTGEGSMYREEKKEVMEGKESSDILAGIVSGEKDILKSLIEQLERIYAIGEDTEKAFVRGIIEHIHDKTLRLNVLKTIEDAKKKEVELKTKVG